MPGAKAITQKPMPRRGAQEKPGFLPVLALGLSILGFAIATAGLVTVETSIHLLHNFSLSLAKVDQIICRIAP
jgi:hypothetical protein